jgi:hypothetical protein
MAGLIMTLRKNFFENPATPTLGVASRQTGGLSSPQGGFVPATINADDLDPEQRKQLGIGKAREAQLSKNRDGPSCG